MIERRLAVANRLGLHARAAAKLVKLASEYNSRIQLLQDSEEVDAKSMLGVLLLAAPQGAQLILRCDGEDEQEAIKAVEKLFSDRFDEDG